MKVQDLHGENWVWRMNAEDMNADLAEKSTSCPNYTDEDKTMANLTIKDIAKLCGVGTSTVSRAMNDDPGINPETKERILKVVKEFHYVPNNSARNLKVSESNTVGVLVKGRNNSFFQGMYTFIEQELQKIGYDFILKEISWDDNNTMQAVEMVKEQRLKGLIFLGGMIEDLDKIRQVTGCEAVMVGRAAQGNPWIFRQLTEYLKTGKILPGPTIEERKEVIIRHLDISYLLQSV